ncbi:tetraprenyl-beta-curcumene synthase [Salirhabdus euzebyi]|uniref:Tetraprenyl-beta-curcumene synthase n=1 Tax=Salirhabdus euzebyi TaxID=394506 RepID=A0A841QB55_9BACI|nr:tetraprenyl-beta-curcumene synthase family protein [Salirhabdus euzebyi]MBB6455432.1 tetraprenyl-beta-curcumene synthase [Salirhabdus euzebyi]
MNSKVPHSPLKLITNCYRRVFPEVHAELREWKRKASSITNEELRHQALASIHTKTFHCEGGGTYALLAKHNLQEAVRFIVAYQTISDYLDNLCDRSTSLDPKDFELLHQAMYDALTPDAPVRNYYAFRNEQNDNGYLKELVQTCQRSLKEIDNYDELQPYLIQLASLYSDLQVHKHVTKQERITRLTTWFEEHKEKCPDLTWYEFSACTGSTLGIFCLVSYGLGGQFSKENAEVIFRSYFPYMQGLHIMLDYFIDQIEDEREGDLNFCSFYPDHQQLKKRFLYFIQQTEKNLDALIPDYPFHQLIQNGLVGMYLADKKVKQVKHARDVIRRLLKETGMTAKFFYFNTKLYHKIRPVMSGR